MGWVVYTWVDPLIVIQAIEFPSNNIFYFSIMVSQLCEILAYNECSLLYLI